MLALNSAMMPIFYIWVGIHRNSKLIHNFKKFNSQALEFCSQNFLCQSDYLPLLHKISPECLDFFTAFLQDSSVLWLKRTELIIFGCPSKSSFILFHFVVTSKKTKLLLLIQFLCLKLWFVNTSKNPYQSLLLLGVKISC